MAAHIYSMEETFDGKKIYADFNSITSASQVNGASYASYPFKGLYALLLANMTDTVKTTYRGVPSRIEEVKNSYIRFNRFTLTTADERVARGFAGPNGTLYIIKGKKSAFFITPYSYFPNEDEYLIPPHVQLRVLNVDKTKYPIEITMEAFVNTRSIWKKLTKIVQNAVCVPVFGDKGKK